VTFPARGDERSRRRARFRDAETALGFLEQLPDYSEIDRRSGIHVAEQRRQVMEPLGWIDAITVPPEHCRYGKPAP
jgi:hypothetical protein